MNKLVCFLLIVFACIVAGSVDPLYKPLGCYKDDRNDRTIEGFHTTEFRKQIDWKKWPDLSPTINKCGQFAVKKECSIFAVQHFGECFCSVDVNVNYKKHGQGPIVKGVPQGCVNGVGKGGFNYVYRVQGCFKDKQLYSPGSAMPHSDVCHSCLCGQDNQELCRAHQCATISKCAVTKNVPGKCCPVCACQDEHNFNYKNGQTWVTKQKIGVTMTQCLNCQCTGGEAVCTDYSCPALTCTDKVHKYGDCCPVCKPKAQPMTIPTIRPRPTLPDFSFPFPFPDDDEDFKRSKDEIVDEMADLVKSKFINKKKRSE